MRPSTKDKRLRAQRRTWEGTMANTLWFPVLACIALLAYLFLSVVRTHDNSADRLALLMGTRRIWGETDASLRRRATALSRWPFTPEKPQLRWWGRLWSAGPGRK
jgi:hypothetical protein